MTKRFIDLSTLPKAFRKLELSLKWAYVWVWNNCDAAGYWEIDEDYFEFENPGISWSSLDWSVLDGHVLLHEGGILLTDFIPVNYGTLKPEYNPHKPAFRAIEKNNLILNRSLNQACFKLIDEDEDKEEDEEENRGFAKGEKLEPVNPELMGFKGHARVWLEKNHGYVWGAGDDPAIEQIERKVILMLAKPEHPYWTPPTDQKLMKFQEIIYHLDPWVKAKKFSLRYINEHFNEVKNGAQESTGSNGHSHKRGVSLATKTVFRDGGEL